MDLLEGVVKKNGIFQLKTTKIVRQSIHVIYKKGKKVSNEIPNFCTREHQVTKFGGGS